MALIPGSIDLQFVANTTGCHRVCYRLQGGPPTYDCTTQVSCAGNALPCTATLDITVDDASCAPVSYEGYAQACCEDINSPNGRLPFLVTYSATPNCLGYTVTCNGPFTVTSVSIVSPGSGYVPGSVIPIVFTPSLGGVAANAIIGNGGVSDQFGSASPFPFGSGYVDGTYFNVPAINVLPLIGGSGALFTVVVTGGQVVSAVIVPGSNGTGYSSSDTVTFNAANLGGSGSGVIVTIYITNTGQVQNTVIVNPGSGYTTSTPAATLPGGGVNAVLGAVLNGCSTIDLNVCNSVILYNIPAVPANTSFVVCNSTLPSLPVDYSVVQNACCNLCTTITFNKPVSYTNPPATVHYQRCSDKTIQTVVLTSGGNFTDCMVNNSWFVVESDPINGSTTITQSGPC